MCWNEHVSLNTFLFSGFVLCLVFYNNTFTQYKVPGFSNKWAYLLFASFISMQLVEFFIWRNLNDNFYNQLFSKIGVILILLQPIFSMMLISNIALRNILLLVYLLLSVPFTIYKFSTKPINSMRSENGHLRWNFLNLTPLMAIIWGFFFLFGLAHEKKWKGLILAFVLLSVSIYSYYKNKTVASMWCWLANSVMIYYALYLLIYLPYCENDQVC